jgi:hypothetical protein
MFLPKIFFHKGKRFSNRAGRRRSPWRLRPEMKKQTRVLVVASEAKQYRCFFIFKTLNNRQNSKTLTGNSPARRLEV